ncbi:MAG: M48 family metalloprotease [Candidatus Aenigmarchaeota archaeon]|nr:M48 family metalloprotease [Candidatus Aenigmarchaeota archaeon]
MIGCFMGFLVDIDKLVLTAFSLSFAIIFLYSIKKFNLSTKLKVGLIYGHFILLFFPLVLLTTDFACGAMCMPCGTDTLAMATYALPSAILLGTLAGFVVIPSFYMFSNKRQMENTEIVSFVKRYAKKLKIMMPKIYVVDKAKPVAFSFKSFRSAIFVSIGMMDILSKKELQSVILHEMAHLKQKSSMLKVSSSLLRMFSPLSLLARFHHDTGKEELDADNFAIKVQRTPKYLDSAKRKMRNYN